MKKTNILILSAGRRVDLTLAFKNELTQLIPDGLVFAIDLAPNLSAACQIADHHFQAPRVTSRAYIPFLLDLCREYNIGLIIPTIDTELQTISRNLKLFKDHGISAVVSDIGLVEKCRDKRKTASLFSSLGIDSPVLMERDMLSFPLFAKPFDGSCSIGANTILRKEDLTEVMLNDDKLMFMELIGKEFTEFTVDIYYDKKGTLRCLVPRQRVEIRAGEISKGITKKSFIYDYLLHKTKKIPGARGCLTLQLFANEKTSEIKAIEINPRFGGGYPLSYEAGANYPKWLIQEYLLEEDLEFFEDWEENLLMLRYDSKVLVHDFK